MSTRPDANETGRSSSAAIDRRTALKAAAGMVGGVALKTAADAIRIPEAPR